MQLPILRNFQECTHNTNFFSLHKCKQYMSNLKGAGKSKSEYNRWEAVVAKLERIKNEECTICRVNKPQKHRRRSRQSRKRTRSRRRRSRQSRKRTRSRRRRSKQSRKRTRSRRSHRTKSQKKRKQTKKRKSK